MRVLAFQGIRYTPRVGDAGELAAPPYDQINDAARDRFHAQSPHQFVHLSRPVDPAGHDIYTHAADLHERWLKEEVIAREDRPALYPYVIELAGGGRRLGVLALVEMADAKVIRPHEQTLAKAVADRLALLSAMRVDLEPALLVSEDGGRLEALLQEDLANAKPLVRHRDGDGNVHVIYRVDDPDRIKLYQKALDVPAAIADGHHRYKVAQRYAQERGIRPGTAAAAKLAVITSLDSPELTIEPIHRAFKEKIELDKLAGLRTGSQTFNGSSGQEFAAAVAAAPQPALGVWVSGQEPEIWSLKASSPLVVEVFQNDILPALGLPAEASTNGTVVYRAQPAELWDQVSTAELGTGIFLPPMAPTQFAAAIADGALLPAKSTRFVPKVMSGLVWADHQSQVL
ncbi:MAG TPA: DUF1015 domain-containing protein [Thermoanaerobaculia bacterium]|nr:DUF1015 domain-containing protein [Thermoanaerobaculia bacterium]